MDTIQIKPPESSLDELIKNKEYTRALAVVEVQVLTPENLFKKAKILWSLDKIDEAISILMRLEREVSYREDEVSYYLGFLCQHEKRYDEAKYWYKIAARYRTTAEKARQHIEELSALSPEAFDDKEEKVIQIKVVKSDVTFKDAIGIDEAKEYLRENIIGPIKDRSGYDAVGKKVGTGLILYGPPGTGKTLLAKALAGETDTYFLAAHINQLVGSYVGVTSKNIATLFLQARMHAPSIVFIDEVDIIGTKRGNDSDAHSNVMKQAVNQLLIELQGMDKNQDAVFVVTATNRPWDIDPALKRSGRLGDSLYLGIPNLHNRIAIINHYLDKLKTKIIVIVNVRRIARATEYYTPADLESVIDKSLLPLIERSEKVLHTGDILKVIRKYRATTLNWFETTKSELQGEPVMDYSSGTPIVVGYRGGRLTPQEREEYDPLISDVKKNTDPRTRQINFIKTLIAKYVL